MDQELQIETVKQLLSETEYALTGLRPVIVKVFKRYGV